MRSITLNSITQAVNGVVLMNLSVRRLGVLYRLKVEVEDLVGRIDNYFSDYYSGVIDMQIARRKIELRLPTVVDENQGGGRAEKKQSRVLDDQLIVEESDFILQSFIRDKWVMDQFLKVLTEYECALLMLKFGRRKKRGWVQVL